MADMDIIQQLVKDVGRDTALVLIELFETDVEKRLAIVHQQVESNQTDISSLRQQAHSLKGLCHTYGALLGGDCAVALEQACDGGDEGDIRQKAQAALKVIPQDVSEAIASLKTITNARP